MVFKSKKGQEGFSNMGTMIAIILLVLGLILIALGSWLGFDYIFSKLGFLPDDLTTSMNVCKTYAENTNTALSEYCKYRSLRLEDVKQYASCEYVRTVAIRTIGESNVEFDNIVCDVTPNEYCVQLACKDNYKPKTVVNGKKCSEWDPELKSLAKDDPKCTGIIEGTCGSLNGIWYKTSDCPENYDYTNKNTNVEEIETKMKEGYKVCCIPRVSQAV